MTIENLVNKLYEAIGVSKGISTNPLSINYEPGKEHIWSKHNLWTMSGWKENEIQLNRNHIIDDVEKLRNGKTTILD